MRVVVISSSIYHRRRQNNYHLYQSSIQLMHVLKIEKEIFINHLRNPIVNPADILPVNGIPKLVIANEEAVAAAWLSLTVPPLIIGICIVRFASVVIAPSDNT